MVQNTRFPYVVLAGYNTDDKGPDCIDRFECAFSMALNGQLHSSIVSVNQDERKSDGVSAALWKLLERWKGGHMENGICINPLIPLLNRAPSIEIPRYRIV